MIEQRARPTQIGGGVQYHHRYNLDGASKDAMNAVQWLRGLIEVTDDPEHQALFDAALALSHRVGAARNKAHAQLEALLAEDRDRFDRCRAGLEPWPGERVEGFQSVCTCDRRCLYHVTQAPAATPDDCNCAVVCPSHGTPRTAGDRAPVASLPLGPGQLPLACGWESGGLVCNLEPEHSGIHMCYEPESNRA